MIAPFQAKLPLILKSPSSTMSTPYPVLVPLRLSAVNSDVGSGEPLTYTTFGRTFPELSLYPQQVWLFGSAEHVDPMFDIDRPLGWSLLSTMSADALAWSMKFLIMLGVRFGSAAIVLMPERSEPPVCDLPHTSASCAAESDASTSASFEPGGIPSVEDTAIP